MQRKKTIVINDIDITVTELSVAQVRDYMDDKPEQAPVSIIDLLFPDSLPGRVIAESTGLSVKKLEDDFSPSELKKIVEAVESLNPFFVNMMKRLSEMGREIIAQKTLTPSAAG